MKNQQKFIFGKATAPQQQQHQEEQQQQEEPQQQQPEQQPEDDIVFLQQIFVKFLFYFKIFNSRTHKN